MKFYRYYYTLTSIAFLLACTTNATTNGTTNGTATGGTAGSIAGGTAGETSAVVDSTPEGPLTAVTATDAVPSALSQALASANSMNAASLKQAYAAPATAALSYDPASALGLDTIQASELRLNEAELSKLYKNGLVVSKRQQFPSFAYGYKSIYFGDLPVYVSADSILEAVHRTFDVLLKQTEEQVLVGELSTLLGHMRGNLGGSSLDSQSLLDADLYLTLADGMLKGVFQPPAFDSNAELASKLFGLATLGSGHQIVKLFGVSRDEDFSQFTPRGHYVDTAALRQYFRAMMWLGRVDLRLVETQSNGSQVFYRRQFDAAVALRELLSPEDMKLWEHIDSTIGAYVGEHDSMTLLGLDGMMSALGVRTFKEAQTLDDQSIIDGLAKGGWGAQRIASRIIYNDGTSTETLPLDRSFMLFGQRYTVDSHAFVNVTYDRVAGRMMPKPLDAAFSALGNNAALGLLEDEFSNESYVQGLAKTRALVDAHEPAYWEGSIYTRWLSVLRTLSPRSNADLPSFAKTPLWQNRILSTQLGSWSELRHDTILYVKQSYTSGQSCEFPDAYVDPYPEFYAKLGTLADAVEQVAASLPTTASALKSATASWSTNFKSVTSKLQQMASNQLTGAAHSPELIAFINDAVKWDTSTVCGATSYSNLAGWYLKLYLNDRAGLEADPVVADVHTQPTDESGADVGRILHVGTGLPRLMVVTVETCSGPRAYVGLTFAYGEKITDKWKRLTDPEWATEIKTEPFPDVPWMGELLSE